MIRLAPVIAAAAALLVLPASALAEDYCVAPNTSCGGTNVGTLEAAFLLAGADTDRDRVFLGAATYEAPTVGGYLSGPANAPVELIGTGATGPGRSTITAPAAAGRVLLMGGGPESQLRDLEVLVPESAPAASMQLDTTATVRRIAVDHHPNQPNQFTAVGLGPGASLLDSTVEAPLGAGANLAGVRVGGDGVTVARTKIVATTGVAISNAMTGATVERLDVTSSAASIEVAGTTVTVRSSILRPNDGIALFALDQPGSSAELTADGVTILGSGAPDTTAALASNHNPAPTFALVRVTNSIIRGVAESMSRFNSSTGEASVAITYSDFDETLPVSELGGGAGTFSPPQGSLQPGENVNLDPGFVDFPGGDLRLAAASPLIDLGDPATPQGTDYPGAPLVVDGNGDGIARRDLGAFEFQPPPPPGPAPGPGPGADPSPSPPGADTVAPFATGFRAAPARVKRGRSTRFRFTLSEPATVAVAIERVLRGRRVRGRCRAPSARNRRRPRCERRIGVTRLRLAGVAGPNSLGFRARRRGKPLPTGRYRARLTAVDAAGNRGAARTVAFRVVR